jgi:hypothetical protein
MYSSTLRRSIPLRLSRLNGRKKQTRNAIIQPEREEKRNAGLQELYAIAPFDHFKPKVNVD